MNSNSFKTITHWLRQNISIFILPVLYWVYLFFLLLPPSYRWFELHRIILSILQVLTGFVDYPLTLLSFESPTIWAIVITIIYLGLAGLIIGKAIPFLWKKGWVGKTILTAILSVNLLWGFFIVEASGTPVFATQSHYCENYFSARNGLRIITFQETGIFNIEPGVHFFYLYTSDGGKNWQQLMHTRLDDLYDSDCTTTGTLDGFIWIWSSNGVRTTLNNGNTWTVWDWKSDFGYGFVEQVDFKDSQNGVMQVYPGHSKISELLTTDGGRTWTPR